MRHAHAPALVDRGLRLHDAFLVLAVVVRVELEAGGLRGGEQGVVERILVGHGRYLQRPIGAAPVAAVAVREVLHSREQRRDIVPAPAAVAHLCPGIEVERLAAHPDQSIDRAGAAQYLAARHRDHAVRGVRFGFGLIEPVGGGIVDQQAETERHAGVRMTGLARLEQQDLVDRVFAQARRQGAARRARPHDDVVILVHA